jgi:(E)-4-hydroxy-3-methylbut-2-enyl-diphosphate synthase
VVACPTCGRVEGNVIELATRVEEALAEMAAPIQVAVMGCLVNGPGEAREADVGLALSHRGGTIFRKGQRVREVGPDEMLDVLLDEARRIAAGDSEDAADEGRAAPPVEPAEGDRKRLPVVPA